MATTPPIGNFFGVDPRFLGSPAGGTALVNNILFGSSFQQVPINFGPFYTGIPPIFGGDQFKGLNNSSFNFFSNPNGPSGLEAILGLGRSLDTGNTARAGTAATAAKPAATAAAAKSPATKSTSLANMTIASLASNKEFSNLTLGNLLDRIKLDTKA